MSTLSQPWGSALGPVGPLSRYSTRMREQIRSATSISEQQHVKLFQCSVHHIHVACYREVKHGNKTQHNTTNKQIKKTKQGWTRRHSFQPHHSPSKYRHTSPSAPSTDRTAWRAEAAVSMQRSVCVCVCVGGGGGQPARHRSVGVARRGARLLGGG